MIYERHGTGLMVEGRFIYAGMPVRVNENSCYAGLYGRIVEIRTGKDLEEESSAPAVYCRFGMPARQEDVHKLEENLSAACQQPTTLKDISLDRVRMDSSALEIFFPTYVPARAGSVWTVVEDWAAGGAAGHREQLYELYNDAVDVFYKKLSNEAEGGCVERLMRDDELQIDCGEGIYECWLDCEYLFDHYKISLEEKPIVLGNSVSRNDIKTQERRDVSFFTLPNGIKLVVSGNTTMGSDAHEGNLPEVAILAQYPSGTLDDLCFVAYDPVEDKLRVRAFDGSSEDAAFECNGFQFQDDEEQTT